MKVTFSVRGILVLVYFFYAFAFINAMKRHSTGKNGMERDATEANGKKKWPANAANSKLKKQTGAQRTKSNQKPPKPR